MKTQKADLEERERRLAQCSSLFTGRDAIVSCSQACIKMLLFIKHTYLHNILILWLVDAWFS